jgi:nitrate/nitrite transport system ATP-binding protein
MPFLELKNVSKRFGATEILSDINLNIEEGEFVAIIGYSGAGKTTLMSLIAGLQQPDTGTMKLEGKDITEPSPERGLVFQNYSLLPWLTAYENIALAVDQVFPKKSKEERRQHAEKYIKMVNLSHATERLPHELSGGMRQRVSVARTLAMQPRILLLDEPLSALDALTRATLQDEILRIRASEKSTIILITNDPDEGILMADRIIPLTAGPRATLGPSIPVFLPHPRVRTELNQNYDFKQIRNEVIDYLLKAKPQHKLALKKNLILPDIEPENIEKNPPSLFSFGSRPVRRSEIKKETVEVDL